MKPLSAFSCLAVGALAGCASAPSATDSIARAQTLVDQAAAEIQRSVEALRRETQRQAELPASAGG